MKLSGRLILTLIAGCNFAHAQTQTLPLAATLHDKILVIRGFYRTEQLHFSSDGKLVDPAESGFGATDATFHVVGVELRPGQVLIKGDLPTLYYKADTGTIQFAEGSLKRQVLIDLADSSDQKAVEQAIWKTFYRPGDPEQPSCTAEEKADYQALQLAAIRARKSSLQKEYGPNGLCLPLGEHVTHKVGREVEAPKQIHTPDPGFPADAHSSRPFDDTVILGVVIDETGKPSTISVLKSLGSNFDRDAVAAVHGWRMKPAMFQGKPVAVYVSIEMRFRRS